jgi:hypothetical protein
METKKTVILPVDSQSDERVAFFTLKEFPTERMIFLAWPDGVVKAETFSAELKKLGIPSSIVKVSGANPWEDFYRAVVDACEGLPKDSIIINISSADRVSQCALTNAAHVNGLKAVAVIHGKMILMPILKLAYSDVLSGNKKKIMQALGGSCLGSLEELSRRSGISLQLVSYHVNGNPKSPGLVGLELVETSEEKGRVKVCLSTMGRLLMDGYIKGADQK